MFKELRIKVSEIQILYAWEMSLMWMATVRQNIKNINAWRRRSVSYYNSNGGRKEKVSEI